jgi:hypothetical protein
MMMMMMLISAKIACSGDSSGALRADLFFGHDPLLAGSTRHPPSRGFLIGGRACWGRFVGELLTNPHGIGFERFR